MGQGKVETTSHPAEQVGGRDRPTGAEAVSVWSRNKPRQTTTMRGKHRRGPSGHAAPAVDPLAQLRAELRRWSLCQTFRHQFAVIAAPVTPRATKGKPVKRRKGGQGERAARNRYVRHFDKKKRPKRARRADSDTSFDGEEVALRQYFRARVEILQRTTPRRDVAAAVRALRDEQQSAMRALTARQKSMAKALRALRDQEWAADFASQSTDQRRRRVTFAAPNSI